jgi:hypothetical protein
MPSKKAPDPDYLDLIIPFSASPKARELLSSLPRKEAQFSVNPVSDNGPSRYLLMFPIGYEGKHAMIPIGLDVTKVIRENFADEALVVDIYQVAQKAAVRGSDLYDEIQQKMWFELHRIKRVWGRCRMRKKALEFEITVGRASFRTLLSKRELFKNHFG